MLKARIFACSQQDGRGLIGNDNCLLARRKSPMYTVNDQRQLEYFQEACSLSLLIFISAFVGDRCASEPLYGYETLNPRSRIIRFRPFE